MIAGLNKHVRFSAEELKFEQGIKRREQNGCEAEGNRFWTTPQKKIFDSIRLSGNEETTMEKKLPSSPFTTPLGNLL